MRRAIVILLMGLLLPAVRVAAQSRISIAVPDVGVDFGDINHWSVIRGLNSALGDGLNLRVDDHQVVIQFDTEKLPGDWDQSCEALGRFTDVVAPDAVAAQNRRFGLHLPRVVYPQRPLVVLIHGLDGDRACCDDLEKLLGGSGYQTAYFAYAAERPLDQSAELFGQQMRMLHEQFPSMRIDLISESMGGLVARKYVEGPSYVGGVDHFILIAPPNEGSTWTPYSFLLKLGVNAWRWQHDPQWSPAWMINEGIDQAAEDLQPDSKFLADLNSQPRRSGVRYTIVAGDQPLKYRVGADLIDWSGGLLGERVGNWWGFRAIKTAAGEESRRLRGETGDDDGPVNLNSTRLAGVTDFQTVTADHPALYESIDRQTPAAWPVIRDRLSK